MSFDNKDLKCKRYELDQVWMMIIAYYRGTLDEYKNHPKIQALVKESRDCDYIIAPIADNRMFQIINIQANDILELINEEYGISNYGKI